MAVVKINGSEHEINAPDHMPLLWAIRDFAELNGTKYGCGTGLCGSCTVHIDGVAVKSCQTAISEVQDAEIVTIEGLDPDGEHPVQQAWRDQNVPQCGFCQAGQIMQAAGLLAQNPNPSDQEILNAMAGNVCRCGCYQRIISAVRQAATGA